MDIFSSRKFNLDDRREDQHGLGPTWLRNNIAKEQHGLGTTWLFFNIIIRSTMLYKT